MSASAARTLVPRLARRTPVSVVTGTLGSTELARVGFRGVLASATRSDANSPSYTPEDAKRDHCGQRDEALVGLPCCTGFHIYTRRSQPGTLASRPWHRGSHLGRARPAPWTVRGISSCAQPPRPYHGFKTTRMV